MTTPASGIFAKLMKTISRIEENELKELVHQHPDLKDVLSRYHLDRVTATTQTLKSFLNRDNIEGIVS